MSATATLRGEAQFDVGIEIGGIGVRVRTDDPSFVCLLERRYAGFVGSAERAEYQFNVNLTAPTGIDPDEDVRVERGGGRNVVARAGRFSRGVGLRSWAGGRFVKRRILIRLTRCCESYTRWCWRSRADFCCTRRARCATGAHFYSAGGRARGRRRFRGLLRRTRRC